MGQLTCERYVYPERQVVVQILLFSLLHVPDSVRSNAVSARMRRVSTRALTVRGDDDVGHVADGRRVAAQRAVAVRCFMRRRRGFTGSRRRAGRHRRRS